MTAQVQIADIVSFLRERIVRRTGIPDAELGNEMVLADLGVSSLDAVLISGEVEDRFDLEVDPTLMFEYRTINAISARLAELMHSA